nr:uncharacterized protein LOC129263947 [Lytechinus pictus]
MTDVQARKSSRERQPTEKMSALQASEEVKIERKFFKAYGTLKTKVKEAREVVKTGKEEELIRQKIEGLEEGEKELVDIFEVLRKNKAPIREVATRMDRANSMVRDGINALEEVLGSLVGPFDAEDRKQIARELLKQEYAQSVFSSSLSEVPGAESSQLPEETPIPDTNSLASRRMMPSHDKASYRPPSDEDVDNPSEFSRASSIASQQKPSQSTLDMQGFAQTLADSMYRTRLPVPVPSTFSGNPLEFVEFERSFTTLIGDRISAAEKLYYLRQYVTGPAREAIAGFFYGSTESAYEGAWKSLRERYGHPFRVQQAFRDKLNKWPKISARDPEGLQKFADCLKACNDAMPYVDGLAVLNDCNENQKLLGKLPDWLITSWNRIVSVDLEKGFYPSFSKFSKFVAQEAKIANNPISSLGAVKGQESFADSGAKASKAKRDGLKRGSALATKGEEKPSTSTNSQRQKGGTKSKDSKTCAMCSSAEHQLEKCQKFKDKTLSERKEFIKKGGLCFGCLRKGHMSKECKKRLTCEVCSKRHPSLLHEYRVGTDTKSQSPSQGGQDGIDHVSTTSHKLHFGKSINTSMIVPVWVSSEQCPSHEILTYALLDTQSDASFILEDLAEALRVQRQPVKLQLSTMTSSSTIHCDSVSNLVVRGMTTPTKLNIAKSYTRSFIPADRDHIPTRDTADKWPHLQEVAREMSALQGCEVGLLIGYNCPRALVPRNVVTGNDTEPYAIHTDLGWSIIGVSNPEGDTSHCGRVATRECPGITPKDVLRALEPDFKQESNSDTSVSQDDVEFINCLGEGISRNEDGHLEMPLPFKKRPEMPNNRRLAEVRLRHLSKKMERDDDYKVRYKAFMSEIIERGYAERAHDDGQEGSTNYIPHHGVFHPQKRKLRVVFDCAARSGGTCLNDHLLKGPDLTNSLTGVLLRFRLHEVALMCDIEKMFFQFRVTESHQDFLRFLWWEGGKTQNQPVDFRMRVHLFGAASSPGCANYGLKYLANAHKDEFPLAACFISRNFYVDDGITSVPETEDAIRLVREAVSLCKKGGIRLHKFVSNSKKVIESIPESERASGISGQDLSFEDSFERALGIWWNVGNDHLCFKISLKDQPSTRRGILSTVASLYDPLGFVAPVVLKGKRILQEMCRSGIGWDDPIPETLQPAWNSWIAELPKLEKLQIPRCHHPPEFGPVSVVQLHHFSDASTSGYGQCSYVRLVNNKGEVHCCLIYAKARVAPTKVVTIPRLELTAAVVSAKVSTMLKNELELQGVQEFFWTDSRVVLGYINNEARRFHTFVANRVQLIRDRTPQEQWHYIPTEENPADHASRGMGPEELVNSNQWMKGPDFLWEQNLSFKVDVPHQLKHGDPEVRVTTFSTNLSQQGLLHRLTRIADWSMMIRVLCRLNVVAQRIRHSKDISVLQSREKAKLSIIQMVQKEAYAEELHSLTHHKPVRSTSKIHALDPFVDENGVLRVGGRLQKLSMGISHPIILPKQSPVTEALVRHIHQKVHHQGRGVTQNELRAQGYWIVSGSKVVAELVRNCVTCRRLRRPEEVQKMADLPEERTEPTPPFTFVGMDCFGPFMVKRGRSEVKRYGLLFTCFCSRGVHIEMLDDMSTESFILALRCFIAIRGAVRQIRCDQGTNFVGARNELQAAVKEMNADKVEAYLAEKQCEFIFNAPHSSHAGGVWERQIRTIRNVLRATIDLCPGRLTDTALRCLFYEAMTIVNSRPLSMANINDPNADAPLTPNHLLTFKTTTPLPPPGEFPETDMYARKAWRRVQFLLEQFWSRWRKEYLLGLQERRKLTKPHRNLQVGDVVLVIDQEVPRMKWPLAVVTAAAPDADGLVRKVRVRVGNKELDSKGRPLKKPTELLRPIQKIVLLMESS